MNNPTNTVNIPISSADFNAKYLQNIHLSGVLIRSHADYNQTHHISGGRGFQNIWGQSADYKPAEAAGWSAGHLARFFNTNQPEIPRLSYTRQELETPLAARDLGAKHVPGIHRGVFDLADEPLNEPPEKFKAAVLKIGLPADRMRVLPVGGILEVQGA